MSAAVHRGGPSLYHQLREYIEARITGGEWKPGDQIPPESALQKQFGVSRATVRQAVNDLVYAGRLVKKQGIGTYVTDPKPAVGLIDLYFPPELGTIHRLLKFCRLPCPASAARKLNVTAGEAVYELHRVRLFGETPAMLQRSYMAERLFPNLEAHDLTRQLYAIAREQYGFKALRLDTFIEPVLIRSDEAAILKVDVGVPALLLERVVYSDMNQPIILTVSVVRGDQCRFLIRGATQEIPI